MVGPYSMVNSPLRSERLVVHYASYYTLYAKVIHVLSANGAEVDSRFTIAPISMFICAMGG